MAAMSSAAAEMWELADQEQPGPGDMPGEPAHAETMRAEIRALPRWAWIYLPEAHRAGTCSICRAPFARLAPIYVTRTGRRLAWHPACCPVVQELHVSILGGSSIFPSSSNPVKTNTQPAQRPGLVAPSLSGDTPEPRPFFVPATVTALVGAPGRRMTPATLTAEVVR